VEFEASGKSFKEALENSALALFQVIAKVGKLKKTKKIIVRESASSRLDLAVALLHRLVAECDAQDLLFKGFQVKEIVEDEGKRVFSVAGVALGQTAEASLGNCAVKAVTYHNSSVKFEEGKWKIRVVLDI
jgi:SHS2 domain-containing protein